MTRKTPAPDPTRGNSESSPPLEVFRPRRLALVKPLGLVLAVSLAIAAYLTFGEHLSLSTLARHEHTLREWAEQRPLVVVAVAFALYVVVVGLSIPGGTPLTLGVAWLLGFWRGLILVSLASTTGALIAFLLSRYLLRDWIEARLGRRVQKFREVAARDGAFYLFTLRLIPVVPFVVINSAMGLTSISARTFWWVSQLGMLPGTAIYAYAGSSVPSLEQLAEGNPVRQLLTPQLLLALALLGIFPLLARWLAPWLLARLRALMPRNAP